ncbi:unnamed protein product [Moneuplotes crassus]|uniref:Uncharacterized protein n=1 Tax=Euplotes crassus TaxID=5936 RepID=A0AAD2CXN7_EUPCR|nr:unnamed protein product [Moneuplotes crassus]
MRGRKGREMEDRRCERDEKDGNEGGNESSLKTTQRMILMHQLEQEKDVSQRVVEDTRPVNIKITNSLTAKNLGRNHSRRKAQYQHKTPEHSPKPINKGRKRFLKMRSRTRKTIRKRKHQKSIICHSGRKFVEEDLQISLCCATNELKMIPKQKIITGKEITKFYNNLVPSDFSRISSSPVTFNKAHRFKERFEKSPGPGHYTPQRQQMSSCKSSKSILNRTNPEGCTIQLWPLN